MFDIGWMELLVVAVVALVAVGPKELPSVMRTLGVWAGKVRRVFLALQHDFERLEHEAEVAHEQDERDEPKA
jgi:sec-independent protein translocase protein TatB